MARCVLCKMEIESGQYCVFCYKKYLRRCLSCQDAYGKLEHRFQRHKGMGSEVDCPRCGPDKRHDWYVQLVCPVCNNERFVFEPPVVA